ncbi:MAG: aspartate aminotransferase family protein, partial [Fulvivirga sp.]|nr:aspartate aminotransferase family protein [Fulvivirga sp.]
GFELMTEPFLNFTAFRYHPSGKTLQEINLLNKQLLDDLNASGELFLSHTKIDDQYILRIVIGQTYVEKKHVDKALSIIKKIAKTLSI